MSHELQKYSIAKLIAEEALTIGDGYRAKNEELGSSGVPFARAGNINGDLDFAFTDYFPEHRIAVVGDKMSRPDDVVFTSIAKSRTIEPSQGGGENHNG